ncbi:hypothetical protein GLYMA_04G000151v4 [Glycine max]|nr:hypothetical protein GLYMA_04G000151v4 [Glycine max]KAH1109063.1 hypothetical protein GYH30_008458 [Glycine max]
MWGVTAFFSSLLEQWCGFLNIEQTMSFEGYRGNI